MYYRTKGAIAINAAHHFYGKEESPPIVREISCNGSEAKLGMCPMSWGLSHHCDQTCQAGVACSSNYLQYVVVFET